MGTYGIFLDEFFLGFDIFSGCTPAEENGRED
jgi:hypothetical protein